jgi:Leucine Rich repeat
VRNGLLLTGRLLLVASAAVFAGCSEGPPTRAELDAIAEMQRVHGQVATNAEGHADSLILAGTDVRDTELAPVAELHDLTFLSLERTPIGDAGLAFLAGLTNLKSLSLAGTKVTDAGLAQLAALSSLENLDLQGTSITDRGLAELIPIKSLRKVYVSRGGFTSAGIDNLESANPRLHVTRQ